MDGSVFFIDELNFTGITSAIAIDLYKPKITLYPNPVLTEMNTKNLPPDARFIEITDCMGKVVDHISVPINEEIKINTQNYIAGIYFCNVINNRGENIFTSKFNVLK